MIADGIRFNVYYYDENGTKLWILDQTGGGGNYVTWSPGPNTISVKRKVEWKLKSTGTKQLKVFKFKGRQVGILTMAGKVGTILYKKLEYLSISKVVLDVQGQYTEPGGTVTYYPLLTPVEPYLGVNAGGPATPIQIMDPTGDYVDYEEHAFYIITGITGKMQEYAVMDHPTKSSSKRETVIDVTLTLERIDEGKITPSEYLEW